jgi:hypothetical protein
MPYFRVTFEGYQEGEYATMEEAKQAFIDFVENGEVDGYGRTLDDLISI